MKISVNNNEYKLDKSFTFPGGTINEKGYKVLDSHIGALKHDIHTKNEMWGLWTDSLCKEGHITQKQYNNWSNVYE